MPIPKLFQPISLRAVTARNRIMVAPMCQYSATDGLGDDWHIQNLGAKAMGGPGIVMTEATHVSALGRITHGCLGLWNEAQQAFAARLAKLIAYGGGVPAMQIAHAGRKASSQRPWEGGGAIRPNAGGWLPWAPSPMPYHPDTVAPHAMTADEIRTVIVQFATTARLARETGFKILELHGAHGYLLHSVLSPISNHRNDGYGGDLRGRATMLMETVDAVRAEWPDELPLFVRLSCTDYLSGGLTLDDTVALARWLRATGKVDLIDCSSGGVAAEARVSSVHPGYQVPFADRIRRDAEIATAAVGMIRSAELAAEIVDNGRADLVAIGRAVLADPAWPLRAAVQLGVEPALVNQYLRAAV